MKTLTLALVALALVSSIVAYRVWREEQQEINSIHFTQKIEYAIWSTHSWHPMKHFYLHRSGRY